MKCRLGGNDFSGGVLLLNQPGVGLILLTNDACTRPPGGAPQELV